MFKCPQQVTFKGKTFKMYNYNLKVTDAHERLDSSRVVLTQENGELHTAPSKNFPSLTFHLSLLYLLTVVFAVCDFQKSFISAHQF